MSLYQHLRAEGFGWQQLAVFWYVLVICGCLGLFGNSLSTISAQSPAFPPTRQEILALAVPVSARKRKRSRHTQESVDVPDVAACYAHFSTELQRDESIEQQLRACRQRAESNGHQIGCELEFIDRATSGTKLERDGLNQMIESASRGEFNVLYLYSLSRLAREFVISMPMLKKLVHKYGVRVICLTEGIDSAREGWEMMAAIFSAVHQQFLDDLRRSVLRGHEHAIMAGNSVGDWCFGYGSESVPGTENVRSGRNGRPRMIYIINQEHADWVAKIFTWFVDEGRSIRWIVRELNRLQAPKDHRSSSPEWHHRLVISLLENSKYIGVWPWGERTNVRDPETGKIRQEFRPEEESSQWTREFPHLRIIDDPTFEKAQQKLTENAEKWAEHRTGDGKLRGSSAACNGKKQVKLLSGLIRCDACGCPFHSTGKRLYCRSKNRGTCSVNSSVPVEVVEALLLEELGRVISGDEAWFDAVFDELIEQHQAYEETVPVAVGKLERELSALEQKIERLLDRAESDNAPDDLNRRLERRQQERSELQRDLRQLKLKNRRDLPPPTREWLRGKLDQLSNTLVNDVPEANAQLRALIPDGIRMKYVEVPNRKRGFFRGQFELVPQGVCQAAGKSGTSEPTQTEGYEVTIDFHLPDDSERQREIAMEMYQEGRPEFEIAEELQVSRSRVTAILKEAFELRGEEKPDGRSRRAELSRKHREPPLYQRVADNVKKLCDDDKLLVEVSEQLDIDRNTVTKALKFWYESRDLPVPDGRTRRKSLSRKSTEKANADNR